MKYMFFTLAVACCFLACEDAQDEPAPSPTDINVRLRNQTDQTFQTTFLRFLEQGPDATYFNFGQLGPDEVTEYQIFDQAGTCGIDFFGDTTNNNREHNFESTCECICPLSPGNYTANLSFRISGNIAFFDVSLSED